MLAVRDDAENRVRCWCLGRVLNCDLPGEEHLLVCLRRVLKCDLSDKKHLGTVFFRDSGLTCPKYMDTVLYAVLYVFFKILPKQCVEAPLPACCVKMKLTLRRACLQHTHACMHAQNCTHMNRACLHAYTSVLVCMCTACFNACGYLCVLA